jgi:hypothetical protein
MSIDAMIQDADIEQAIKTLIAGAMKEPTTREELDAYELLRYDRRLREAAPLFPSGRFLMTPGVMESVAQRDMLRALGRHLNGDWGRVCREDWVENELSLREGFRLFSVYDAADGTRFWIITEANRIATTVLLPSEY